MDEQQPKKRGRPKSPPLSPEEAEQRRLARNAKKKQYRIKTDYAAEKKYRAKHPDQRKSRRDTSYQPKVRIAQEYKETFDTLLQSTGLSITDLFITAVEEKYGVILHKVLDDKSSS